MIRELRIKDFAIIDDLELTFGPGFVVFTGETGAGKSIIIDAVEVLLGGRADTTMIRSGVDTAIVEGSFELDPLVAEEVRAILEREDLLEDRDFVTLAREIRRQGRNIGRVNGRSVNLGILSEIGAYLVDVHGQSEHLSLLRVREHLGLLDRYARQDELQSDYFRCYRDWAEADQELRTLKQKEQDAVQRADLLGFQVEEIRAAKLNPGEDVSLKEERARLANAEQLAQLAEYAIQALDESLDQDSSATGRLGRVADILKSLAQMDPSMEQRPLEAQALLEQVSDLVRDMRIYRETIEYNPQRLQEVEERLGLIYDLERKYGEGIETILQHAEEASEELDAIQHAEGRIQELEHTVGELLETIGLLGSELSKARQGASEQLSTSIEDDLSDLKMEEARFQVQFDWEETDVGAPVGDRQLSFSPTGLDQVEFLVAPNPGEGFKPLAKIASGGETSRLMLGLKSVLAKADRTPTLIFDEIDQGIGGRVGAIVGEKLRGLTPLHQVLCVTHLPQLAAYGDQHFRIEKRIQGGRTVTIAKRLPEPERIPELASMLGEVSDANLESATDLLRQAKQRN